MPTRTRLGKRKAPDAAPSKDSPVPDPDVPTRPVTKKKRTNHRAKGEDDEPPLGKHLAHNEKKIRDEAVRELKVWLSGGKEVESEGEDEEGQLDRESGWEGGDAWEVEERFSKDKMARLWKGVFYCFWMSDKPLIQQSLATDLSSALLIIRPRSPSTPPLESDRFRLSLAFLKGFWEAMVREWNGIDRLRMDKFMLLVRRFVFSGFKLLERTGWKEEAVREYNAILLDEGGPLRVQDPKTPVGLIYHVLDIYLDELERCLASPNTTPNSPSSTLPILQLLQPALRSLSQAPRKDMIEKVVSETIDPLVSSLETTSSEDDEERFPKLTERLSNESGGKEEAKKTVLDTIFKEGAKEDTREANRRKMYAFWKERGGGED